MKKQDLISILREQPHNKKVRVFGSNSWFAMDSTSIAASLIDWLIYECKVDNEQDIFNLEIDGEVIKDGFDYAVYCNSKEPIQELPKETYTQEEENAMYGESHFIQMLEATKDLF